MKQLLIGLLIGLTASACCISKEYLTPTPMKIILTERNFVYTTTVKTEEGTYRLFTLESSNGDAGGITAVKIE